MPATSLQVTAAAVCADLFAGQDGVCQLLQGNSPEGHMQVNTGPACIPL